MTSLQEKPRNENTDGDSLHFAHKQIALYHTVLHDPDDCIEYRNFHRSRKVQNRGGDLVAEQARKWVKAKDAATLIGWLQKLNLDGFNCYCGVHPRPGPGIACNQNIKIARCVFVDIDDITEAEARARIKAAALPEPTLLLSSGHGIWAYWRLTEPMTDLAKWRSINLRLINLLGGDTMSQNEERVARLPGLLNVKELPGEQAHIIGDPGLAVNLAEILAVLPELPPEQPAARPLQANHIGLPLDIPMAKREERARKYVARCPNSIQGSHGSKKLFRVCCELLRFGLEGPSYTAVLDEYNRTKCDPAWSAGELDHKTEDAYKDVSKKGQFGSRLRGKPRTSVASTKSRHNKTSETSGKNNVFIDAPENGATSVQQGDEFRAEYTAADAAADGCHDIDDAQDKKIDDACRDVVIVDAIDLQRSYPTLREEVIGDLCRTGEILTIIAMSKSAKTYLLIALALCKATGRMFLGRFQTMPSSKVLLIDCELHPQTLARRIHAVAKAMGIQEGEYRGRLKIISLRGKVKDLHQLDPIFRAIPFGEYGLIIIDPLFRIYPPGTNENDNAHMAAIFNLLDRYSEMTGASFAISHHSSKGSQSAKNALDVGAGAGAWTRSVDTLIVLRPHEEDDVAGVEVIARSFPPLPSFAMRWRYPLWEIDNDLDPTQLRQAGERGKSSSAKWTPERFVSELMNGQALRKNVILAKADSKGLSDRKAVKLLLQAEAAGLIDCRNDSKDSRSVLYFKK